MSKFNCPSCDRTLPTWLSRPIRCICGTVINDGPKTAPPFVPRQPAVHVLATNPWLAIHQYPVDHRHDWGAADAAKWYERWNASVSGCGSCQTNWSRYVRTSPPDFTSAEAFFAWSVASHNHVSTEHVKPAKLPMNLADARLLYWPKPRGYCDPNFVAVTSLAPRACSRQTRAINSWVDFGLTLHVVNTASEIETLKPLYPQVDHWHPCEVQSELGFKKTATINSLADVAVKLDRTILVINADCEAHGNPQPIIDQLADNTLVIGIRHNYAGNRVTNSHQEQWGIDAFVFTPTMARDLPRLSFGIGIPMWDYWIPLHFQQAGYSITTPVSPWLYHMSHHLAWSQEDWLAGAEIIQSHYGYDMQNRGHELRNSLPLPPGPQ